MVRASSGSAGMGLTDGNGALLSNTVETTPKNQAFVPSAVVELPLGPGAVITLKASRVVPTAAEVRPNNLAMKPCIRYV